MFPLRVRIETEVYDGMHWRSVVCGDRDRELETGEKEERSRLPSCLPVCFFFALRLLDYGFLGSVLGSCTESVLFGSSIDCGEKRRKEVTSGKRERTKK